MERRADQPGEHVVLPAVDAVAYASLSRRPLTRDQRYRLGRNLRSQVPRSSLAMWVPADDRPDPVQQVIAAHEDRLDWLIPVRIGRMIASPYAFLRGTAGIMARDFASLPATGIAPVICGDAHLGNFGFYASPERDLVFDLNDFDEAHPGSWEWDLRRLVTSVWVAGRQNGCSSEQAASAVRSCVAAYRRQIRLLATQPLLSRAFERLDLDRLHRETSDPGLRQEIRRAGRRARTRTSDRALPRLTEQRDGFRRIVEDPPLMTRVPDRDTSCSLQPSTTTSSPSGPSGGDCSRATRSSTSSTGSSASAVWACARISRCARAAARTTSCSCSSSRPGVPSSRCSFTGGPHCTSTRVSGWSSTSRLSRRSATRSWAGRPSTAASTTCASSAT